MNCYRYMLKVLTDFGLEKSFLYFLFGTHTQKKDIIKILALLILKVNLLKVSVLSFNFKYKLFPVDVS